jgi:hypothetical protein
MKAFFVASAAAALLGGCVSTEPGKLAAEAQPVTLSAAETNMVEAAMKGVLKDPESARFERVKAILKPSTGVTLVCGLVNSKNSFGGYTGRSMFAGTLTRGAKPAFQVNAAAGDPDENPPIVRACEFEGIRV